MPLEIGNKRQIWLSSSKLADSRQIGFAIIHDTTYLWPTFLDILQGDCELEKTYQGEAQFARTATQSNIMARILDIEAQADFAECDTETLLC